MRVPNPRSGDHGDHWIGLVRPECHGVLRGVYARVHVSARARRANPLPRRRSVRRPHRSARAVSGRSRVPGGNCRHLQRHNVRGRIRVRSGNWCELHTPRVPAGPLLSCGCGQRERTLVRCRVLLQSGLGEPNSRAVPDRLLLPRRVERRHDERVPNEQILSASEQVARR